MQVPRCKSLQPKQSLKELICPPQPLADPPSVEMLPGPHGGWFGWVLPVGRKGERKRGEKSILWTKESILQMVAVGATVDETTTGSYNKMAYPLTSSSPD